MANNQLFPISTPQLELMIELHRRHYCLALNRTSWLMVHEKFYKNIRIPPGIVPALLQKKLLEERKSLKYKGWHRLSPFGVYVLDQHKIKGMRQYLWERPFALSRYKILERSSI